MDSRYKSVTGYKNVAWYEELDRYSLKAPKSVTRVKTQKYKQTQKRALL
jgi:hypothetical protein